ncbi:radical SAM/SPASM domain-containing protein [Staphylococcus epidermidis]|uniref:radical SAM/SPASM domain-containing protein n=1 Tax=Staphylococcus epidermidis TaxID=1282 RepID=UPI0007E45F43|nr:radical SAM protein [Staphylococcus epidermidis]MBV5159415.1 radical SAM protein [Staphylococcus epidermidis]MCD9058350.1 radical SAM protein [Staphylococcus epidermidis]MCD9077668.1 radical SAM protein [Staphylococcus epidermidis]MEB7330464.1 radical SAM protein [Staphylococcus epidermidis]
MTHKLNIIALEILEGCNLFCEFCVRNAINNLTNKVSIENYKKVVGNLKHFEETPNIALTGGEPFLQNDLLEFCKINDANKVGFSITTNATIKNRKVIDFCADSAYFRHFIISIDSFKPEKHDSIRGNNAFERSMKFIEYIKEKNIPFGINMTVSEDNYLDVYDTILFAKNIGAKDISVATVKPNGRGEATFTLDKLKIIAEQIIKNKDLISDNFKVWATEVTFFLYDFDEYKNDIKRGDTGSCQFADSTLHIRANGDILGCTACEDKVLGNLFKKNELDYLEKVWKHSPILNSVRSKEYLKGECSNCEFLEFCGGCRCRANGVYNDLFAEDPYCPIVLNPNFKESLNNSV